jgi:nicotinamide phosphoribosyltransferase
MSHIEALWDLGYLPIEVKAVPEGTKVPIGVPVLTIINTKPEFFWLTNFLETLISTLLWKPITSATIAHGYRKVLTDAMLKTDKNNLEFVNWQGHDFSMRGMDSIDAVGASALGHLTSFYGSDSLPGISAARKYYDEEGFIGGSVNATEHSVMSAGGNGEGQELATFRHLMAEFPTGILSIVSDTWNLWDVLTKYLPILKKEILARDGKIVIRPDSGDPVDIICGKPHTLKDDVYYKKARYVVSGKLAFTKEEIISEAEAKGVIELLWDEFGGTINDQGYKVLDSHIGAIYGDSITVERAREITERLEAKGFASSNVVLGVGSYTYQFNTRDTYGFAMKATHCKVNGEDREIFKDPITDDGTKKSLKGLLRVRLVKGSHGGRLVVDDQCNALQEKTGMLQVIFKDGDYYNKTTLSEIRKKLIE